MVAYLVIREGAKWTDVVRLVPGESVTIGRAPTNQIVIKDERCSRNHAEVFQSDGRWVLRDLESRNGTLTDGQRITSDHTLEAGNIISIGSCHLAYVHNLAKAFPDATELLEKAGHAPQEDVGEASEAGSVLSTEEPTEITHRKGQSRFLEPPEAESEDSVIPRMGRAAAKLCRLAFELAKSPDESRMADLALAGLFESTQADAGALLTLRNAGAVSGGDTLQILASRTDTDLDYQPISSFLTETVIGDGQAVLARNVMDDSALGIRDSAAEIHTTSVICAPIRQGEQVIGVIHLYSTDPDRALDPDDLEFTLAVADTVAVALENLNRRKELAENLTQMLDENLQLRERLGAQSEIVGSSRAMERVAQEIQQAAPSRATVLVRGESGVGKELVARAVHFSSPRRKGPFVCLNCAALSESLLESELFGHERGAFTGATDRKIGKFEAAHRGTLMLDEIGEMSPTIQAKFLRVLEGHPFERVGGSKAIEVDARVIAATNRDLEKDVAAGRFRRDLYFRLHVLEIVVPALRKRPEDIPILAEHFLARFRIETGRKIRGFSPAALEEMTHYRWPGNVRELKNVVERAVVLVRDDLIDREDLTLSTLTTAGDTGEMSIVSGPVFEPMSLAEMEKRHVLATLRSTGWNKSQAAGILGIERSTLDRKIRRYCLVDER
ncbi:MAG: sigma 54-interacting transcriptional regulator [Pirellulales bacterium]